jgi:hypothetical protein
MCNNCFQKDFYENQAKKAKRGSKSDQAPPPDQATMRQWFVEAGHNANEAARRHLPAGATFHTLAKCSTSVFCVRCVRNSSINFVHKNSLFDFDFDF